MKINRKKRLLEIIIFVSIVGISLLVFKPLSAKIEGLISSLRADLILSLEEYTGLTIDYESVSPSIFRNILIRNVNVYDSRQKEKIGSVGQVLIKYNIFSLLTGDYDNLIDYVKIHNGSAFLDINKNAEALAKIRAVLAQTRQMESPAEDNKKRFVFFMSSSLWK